MLPSVDAGKRLPRVTMADRRRISSIMDENDRDTDDKLEDALEDIKALKAENIELRSMLIHVCDSYNSNYDERRWIRVVRSVANRTNIPFSAEVVDARIKELLEQDASEDRKQGQ